MNVENTLPTRGHYGHLTPDETYKLKQCWLILLRFCGVITTDIKVGGTPPAAVKKAGRFGFGGRTVTSDEDFAAAVENFALSLKDVDPQKVLLKFKDTVRADNADRLVLRFCRARKWDLPAISKMMGDTLRWRVVTWDVEDMMFKGDIYWLDDKGFIKQFEVGKSILAGKDKLGRPIIWIQAKLHHPREQTLEALQRYTLMTMEAVRLVLHDDIETAGLIFDLSGFSLSNMDNEIIKFILQCFEAHYPESLGFVVIHRAPRIFSTIWSMIKGWMDPVVASKIAFTNKDADLLAYAGKSELPPELGGESSNEYHWPPPVAELNEPEADEATRTKLLAEREAICDRLIATTIKWIQASGDESVKLDAERDRLLTEYGDSYWPLDPYVRARCGYDRSKTYAKYRKELAPGGISQPMIPE